MHILHIITGLGNGGAESLLNAMVRSDTNNTHSIISLYTLGHYGPDLQKDGFHVVALDMPRSKLTIKGLTTLYKEVKKAKADVVQTWMYHANFLGGIVCKLQRHKHIVWGLHNNDMDRKLSSRSMHLCNSFCAKTSNLIPKQVIHCSASGAELHVDIGYSKKTMRVVPNGYDISQYTPSPEAGAEIRKELGIDENKFVISKVARWHAQKDHENLMLAISTLNADVRANSVVLLVGSGLDQDNPELINMLDEHGISSMTLCLGTRRDIPKVLNASDIHVLSSAFGESFPNVVNEAMACGVPGVVTNVGDSAFIVGDTGWVVEPKQPADFARCITEAYVERATPAWAQRKARCRQRVIDNFTLETMIARYQSAWELGR